MDTIKTDAQLKDEEKNPDDSQPDVPVPGTGDTIVYTALIFGAVALAAMVVACKRRKKSIL